MSRHPPSDSATGTWSTPLSGLAGRLLVEFEDLNPGLRHAIFLELVNRSFKSVAVTNQPQIQTGLTDSAGNAVAQAGIDSSGPIHPPEFGVIPGGAYLGFRIDMQSVGVPPTENSKALVAVGGKSWEIGIGIYVLKVALSFRKDLHGPINQWVGDLVLPPVDIVVTPEMLKAGTV
jgi:hypothetical protein